MNAKERYEKCYNKYKRLDMKLTNQVRDGDNRYEVFEERRYARYARRVLKRLMKKL